MKTLKKTARLFAAAALGLLLAACSGASSSPESAAKNFVEKSYAGDADAVVSMVYLSEADKAKSGGEDMLRGKVKSAVERKKAYAEQRGGVDEITAEAACYRQSAGQIQKRRQPPRKRAPDRKRRRLENPALSLADIRFLQRQKQPESLPPTSLAYASPLRYPRAGGNPVSAWASDGFSKH